jgi:signal transduction histidine kinase
MKKAFQYLMQIDWVDMGGIYLFDEDRKNLRLVYSTGLSEEYTRLVSVYSSKESPTIAILRGEPRYDNIEKFIEPIKNVLIEEGLTLVVAIPLIYKNKVIGSLNLGSRRMDQVRPSDRMIVESIASRIANLIMLIKTQIKLDKSNSELNTKLQELSIKQQMLIQKSRLESLGELSAGLAHEINQPLSVISLIMENVIYRLEKPDVSGNYLTGKFVTINQNINKIRKLIEHVRIFSRDQGAITFEQVNVNQVIINALSITESQLKYLRIKVITDLSEDIGFTIGNPSRCEQVILNLISNSRDALEEKEKNTMSANFSKELRITTSMNKGHIIVKVWDNGTGISSENLDKIFNPFFTTKTEGRGTGLGLPIVYGIVREMKGEIIARTNEGDFTEIFISLPSYKKKVKNT